MKFQKTLGCCMAALVVGSAFLYGCGGGAVGGNTSTDPQTPLVISPPNVTVFPDTPVTLTVSGGTPPYSVFTSNAVALPVSPTVTNSTFSVTAGSVVADTDVTITVRDFRNASATATGTLRPLTLNNAATLTPFAPTGTGCGTNALCSGGDAQFTITSSLNGLVLRNRQIRFDVAQGAFQLSNAGGATSSVTVATDESGQATVRLTVNANVPTQVAAIQTTDVATGLTRRYNFFIVQQTSGANILSVSPAGTVTFTGVDGPPGLPGPCPFGGEVDLYVFGGTPPYRVNTTLPDYISVQPTTISQSGGSVRVTQNNCGGGTLVIADATGRFIESGLIRGVAGAVGAVPPATTTATIAASPAVVNLACGQSATVNVSGLNGAMPLTTVAGAAAAPALTLVSAAGTASAPGTVTVTRANTGNAPTSVSAQVTPTVVGAGTKTNFTINSPATCP